MYTVTNGICQRKSDRSEGMAIPPTFARKVHMSGTYSGGTPATSGVALYQVAIKSAPRRRRVAPPASGYPGVHHSTPRRATRRQRRCANEGDLVLHDEEGGMVGCKMGKPAFKDRSDSRVSVELVFEEKTDLSSRPVPSMEEVRVK